MKISEGFTNQQTGVEVANYEGEWKQYHLKNDQGMEVSVLNYGGIITRLLVPDREGNLENVVLGYRNLSDYSSDSNYFGALVGRVAGRIDNASFSLDGKIYQLEANDGENHLHGGRNGFHQKLWKVDPFQDSDRVGLVLSQTFDSEQDGYPGNLSVKVSYSLTNENQFIKEYEAKSDETTPLTITNHSYFNLSGGLKRPVGDHSVTMRSRQFVELDQQLIPTGKILDVENSVFDFRKGRRLKEGFSSKSSQNLMAGGGYDHYFIFQNDGKEAIVAADEGSGRRLTINTDQPGVVMYTSNQLSDNLELTEGTSQNHLGVCFETQASPASLHHDGFPSVLLKAGELYKKKTAFKFDTV
ncbi:aldose epimerase family protein [Halobacillus massiliensis]|uniref:aldose epimerase family protein n=1 Tax=Halobacillus massiliensis TaxID=1926286 RepID=UPI0009E407A3|nr:aldose epimerase family protein [Halobacillus massiliensis]